MKTTTNTENEPTITWVLEAKFKDLTDDEIAKLADDILGYQIYGYKESGVYEFARAILRKAQEK